MKNFETNDWLVLNSIIYKIYTINDFDEMRRQFLEQIKTVIDFDSADFYLASAKEMERFILIVMRICRIFMKVLITAGGLCSAAAAWFTGRQILYRMKKESIRSITGGFTSQITGIMPCR